MTDRLDVTAAYFTAPDMTGGPKGPVKLTLHLVLDSGATLELGIAHDILTAMEQSSGRAIKRMVRMAVEDAAGMTDDPATKQMAQETLDLLEEKGW